MNLKRIFFKDSFLYGVTSYLSLIAGLILTPVYTRLLSKEDYGLMDLLNTWNNFAVLMLPLGLTTAILRTFHDFNNTSSERDKHLGTLMSVLVFNSVLYILVLVVFQSYITESYYRTEMENSSYFYSIGIVTSTVLISYFQALNRILYKLRHYVIINLVPFLIMVFGGFYLVVVLKLSIVGFFAASFIGNLTGLIIAISLGKNYLNISFDKTIFLQTLKYSFPLLIVLIFMRFTNLVDRFLINFYLDLKSNGDFSIAMRISGLFQMLIGSFTAAWYPFALSIMNSDNRDELYQKAHNYYILGFGGLCFLTMLFTKELLFIFAPNYFNIEAVTYLLIISTFISGLAYFYGLGIHISKRTYYLIISSLCSFTVNIILGILLIKYIGLIGIGIATLVSSFIWVVVEYNYSRRIANITFNLMSFFVSVLSLLGLACIIILLNSMNLEFGVVILIKILILFSILLYGIRKYELSKHVITYFKAKMNS